MEKYVYYLAHHGVKGMRWGIRRYQNADGSLTPAGKKRKKIDIGKALEPNIKAGKDKAPINAIEKISKDAGNINDNVSKTVKSISKVKSTGDKNSTLQSMSMMSDDELRAVVNRLNLERQYSSLTEPEMSRGFQCVSDILDVAGNVLAVVGSAAAIAGTIHSLTKG